MGSCLRDVAGVCVGLCMRGLKKVAFASLACAFALCGSLIGSMTGAVKGQTTETGLSRGAVIGAVAGAVVSMEVLESCFQGELLSKVGILGSLVSGKIFREWVSPAVLKAYQWQVNSVETSHGEASDIFDISRINGLLPEVINKLSDFKIALGETSDICGEAASCAVCLQDFKKGESARRMPACGHVFHAFCIDRWLLRHGSCPMCRQDIYICAA